MKTFKRGTVLATLLGVTVLTAACSGGNANSLKDDETAVVKVMYWDEQNFFQQYGNLFNAKFPNVEVQVVSQRSLYNNYENMDQDEAWEKFLQDEQPDVLLLTQEQYKKMSEKDALVDLEPMLSEKDFKGEEILPAIIEHLKTAANGKLYGLSPSFYSQAIFYNADLFSKHGIEVPTSKMSWKELFDLAKRFPDSGKPETREYGFAMPYMNSPFQLGMMVGWSEGLVMSDAEVTKMSINTEGWKGAFQTAIDGLKVSPPPQDMNNGNFDYMSRDSFLSGKAAMTVNSPYYVNELRQAKDYNKDFKEFNWEIVSEPVGSNDRDSGSSFGSSEIFAIQSNSPNAKAAWELVKYINSDEAAKLLSRVNRGNLMSRTSYVKDKEGKDLSAFYALKPKPDTRERFFSKMPGNFYQPLNEIGERELKLVSEGKKSMDQALQVFETEAQQALVKSRQEEEAEKAKKGKATDKESTSSSSGGSGSAVATPAS